MFPLATTERMVHRVHRHAPHVWTLAHPAAAPRLADRDVFVIDVADLADRRETFHADLPNLARRHLHRGVLAFFRDELHRGSRAARDLSPLARLELHVVQL